jgi:hypothetical protein
VLKESQQVVILAMDVPADDYWGVQL